MHATLNRNACLCTSSVLSSLVITKGLFTFKPSMPMHSDRQQSSLTFQRTSVNVEGVLQYVILIVHQVISNVHQVLINPQKGQELKLRQLLPQAKQEQVQNLRM